MIQMPLEVIKELAKRSYRMEHLLWHMLRDHWERLKPDAKRQFAVSFPAEWIPPSPTLDHTARVIYGRRAGRDFLFMHRGMIRHVDALLQGHGGSRVRGWSAPPQVGDCTYEVPRDRALTPRRYPAKDAAVWQGFLDAAKQFTCSRYLAGVTIDDLGTQIEFGIHAAMHERFGGWGVPRYRLDFEGIPPIYDDPKYDTLFDAYSAHVHPWFWKIHGWIDARIYDWEMANATKLTGIEPWLGPMAHHHGGHGHGTHAHNGVVERAVSFLIAQGADGHFRARLFEAG